MKDDNDDDDDADGDEKLDEDQDECHDDDACELGSPVLPLKTLKPQGP